MDWQIEYYTDKRGEEPVRGFIDAQSIDVQVAITHDIDLLREFALDLRYPYVFKVGNTGIRELRTRHGSDYYRILYFAFTGRKFVFLHAFLKKTRKMPPKELRVAVRRLNDYEQR